MSHFGGMLNHKAYVEILLRDRATGLESVVSRTGSDNGNSHVDVHFAGNTELVIRERTTNDIQKEQEKWEEDQRKRNEGSTRDLALTDSGAVRGATSSNVDPALAQRQAEDVTGENTDTTRVASPTSTDTKGNPQPTTSPMKPQEQMSSADTTDTSTSTSTSTASKSDSASSDSTKAKGEQSDKKSDTHVGTQSARPSGEKK